MVPPFKDKFKAQTSKAQNKCIRFCLNFPLRSLIHLPHFKKINWLLVSDRVEYYIVSTFFKYWNGTVPGYIHEIFKPSICKYSTRSQVALDIPLQKTNTGQKSLSFLGPKIWSKISPSIKMLEHSLLLCMLLRKRIYFICKANSSYCHVPMIDIII